MIERSRVIKKRKKGFTCSQISTRKFIVDKNLCKNSARIIDVEKLKSNFNTFIYICRSIVCNLPNKRIENQNKYIDVKFSIIDIRRGIIVVNVSNVYNFDACLNQYGTCRRRERFVYNRVESSKILSLKFSAVLTYGDKVQNCLRIDILFIENLKSEWPNQNYYFMLNLIF